MIRYTLLFSLVLLASCGGGNNTPATVGRQTDLHQAKEEDTTFHPQRLTDTTYMPTGFYYLADDGNGVKMRKEGSEEIVKIAPQPFASVANFAKTSFEKTPSPDGDFTELVITFDAKGAKDLQEGTGNPLHPKIATIIAGKLLYVVANSISVKTGVMNIGLPMHYTPQQIDAIRAAIAQKK